MAGALAEDRDVREYLAGFSEEKWPSVLKLLVRYGMKELKSRFDLSAVTEEELREMGQFGDVRQLAEHMRRKHPHACIGGGGKVGTHDDPHGVYPSWWWHGSPADHSPAAEPQHPLAAGSRGGAAAPCSPADRERLERMRALALRGRRCEACDLRALMGEDRRGGLPPTHRGFAAPAAAVRPSSSSSSSSTRTRVDKGLPYDVSKVKSVIGDDVAEMRKRYRKNAQEVKARQDQEAREALEREQQLRHWVDERRQAKEREAASRPPRQPSPKPRDVRDDGVQVRAAEEEGEQEPAVEQQDQGAHEPEIVDDAEFPGMVWESARQQPGEGQGGQEQQRKSTLLFPRMSSSAGPRASQGPAASAPAVGSPGSTTSWRSPAPPVAPPVAAMANCPSQYVHHHTHVHCYECPSCGSTSREFPSAQHSSHESTVPQQAAPAATTYLRHEQSQQPEISPVPRRRSPDFVTAATETEPLVDDHQQQDDELERLGQGLRGGLDQVRQGAQEVLRKLRQAEQERARLQEALLTMS